MELTEAIQIIEQVISDKNSDGDNWYSLNLNSQPDEQADGSFKEIYRADCLFMVTGGWSSTISGALISLAERLKGAE
jgi:hypothetical protein